MRIENVTGDGANVSLKAGQDTAEKILDVLDQGW